ncbi:MAG: TetR/AcrR family transcriptional regulator [Microthrixaceae bacterium]|nr:TetR/AcrR family transcriptional regulator [Microthrixaceae bacterium]
MRRHGWGGDMPADDDEARRRILAAAKRLLHEQPDRAPSVSEVAARLSVTRQTVYRYVHSTRELLAATVQDGIEEFLDAIAAHLDGVTDPADAVVEGIAYTFEQIHERADLALLMAANGGPAHEFTSPVSLALGRSILGRLPVDWSAAGYVDAELDGLVEQMLRTLQSFIVDPGTPPRSPAEFRHYLHRWVGTAVQATTAVSD